MTTPPRPALPAAGTRSGSRAATITIWALVILEAIGIGLVLHAY
jgi:hypothetical protein